MNLLNKVVVGLMLAALRAYRLVISPLLGPKCRFEPSCSQYMMDAIKLYGPFRGTWRGCRRIIRCHPWNPGGWDPA